MNELKRCKLLEMENARRYIYGSRTANLGKYIVEVSSNKPSKGRRYVFIFLLETFQRFAAFYLSVLFEGFLFLYILMPVNATWIYCKHKSKIVKYRRYIFFAYAIIVCMVLLT